ncbi:hypothetical protein BMAGN_1470 [Bifidobacterium magnum]|uniref:Uncharacterized protein n=3 Tax=Bifidobacterium magnum TaxID=1692 RepID=A0A087B6B1_9BIFI|nr:hypothetical protein BMAGN_1470 [Bifidobacterium magnum]
MIVGYKNSDLVYELASQGKFMRPRGNSVSFDPMQLSLMEYMASTTYDFPPTPDMKDRFLPARLYERGWDHVAERFGMWLPGGEEDFQIMREPGGMERLSKKKMNAARWRLGATSKCLQEAGLIKCLRKADIHRGVPAKWLLMLGDDEENRAVEAWARRCIAHKLESDRKP